jgi:CRP/FNR family transcriptional regulator
VPVFRFLYDALNSVSNHNRNRKKQRNLGNPVDTYQKLMEESAAVANYTTEVMSTRFTDVMWLIEQVMWKSLDKRLAKFLLEESAIEETATLNITHEVIANHLGTHREVITRMLKYFQNENIVTLSRGVVTINDSNALEKMCDE